MSIKIILDESRIIESAVVDSIESFSNALTKMSLFYKKRVTMLVEQLDDLVNFNVSEKSLKYYSFIAETLKEMLRNIIKQKNKITFFYSLNDLNSIKNELNFYVKEIKSF